MGSTASRHASPTREPPALHNLPTETTTTAAAPRPMDIDATRDHGMGIAEHTPAPVAPAAALLWVDALEMAPANRVDNERVAAGVENGHAKKRTKWKKWWKHLLYCESDQEVNSISGTDPDPQSRPLQPAIPIQPEISNQPDETNARPAEAIPAGTAERVRHHRTTEANSQRAVPVLSRPAIPKRSSSLGKCYRRLSTKSTLHQRTTSCPSAQAQSSTDQPSELEQASLRRQIRARRAQARLTSGTFTCASPRGVSLSPIENPYLPYRAGREGNTSSYSTPSTTCTGCVSPESVDATTTGIGSRESTSRKISSDTRDTDQDIRKPKTISTPRGRGGFAYSSFHEIPDPDFSVTSRYKHHCHHHRRYYSFSSHSSFSSSSLSGHGSYLHPHHAKPRLEKGKQRAQSPASPDDALPSSTNSSRSQNSNLRRTSNRDISPNTTPKSKASTTIPHTLPKVKTHKAQYPPPPRPPPEIFSTLVYLDAPVGYYTTSDFEDEDEDGLEKWEREVRDAFGLRAGLRGN